MIRRARAWLTADRLRMIAAVAILAAVGAAASLASGPRSTRPSWQIPTKLSRLLDDGAAPATGERVLIGPDGKPVRGKNGKKLLVTRHGTVVDSSGHVVRDRHHRPVKLRHGKTLPSSVVRQPRRRHSSGHARRVVPRQPASRRPVRRPPAAPIVVGVADQDPASADAAFAKNGGNLQAADSGPAAQAVAAYINAHGGIGGRPIQLRLDHVNYDDNQPFDVHDQEVCDFFAQGTRPAVVIEPPSPKATPCLSSHGIPVVWNGTGAAASSYERQYPNTFFEPESLAVDRFGVPYVQGLIAQGFFKGDVRVGALFSTGSDYSNDATDALGSALAAAGVHLAASYTLGRIQSLAGVAGFVADEQTAIIRFRLARVNRVVSVDAGGVHLGLFAQAADEEGYRPLYGISTLNDPQLLMGNTRVARELRGAVGVGWSPITDVGPAAEGPVPAQRALCSSIYQRAGVSTGGRTEAGQYLAYAVCDDLLLLRQVLKGTRAADPATLRARFEKLGTNAPAGIAFTTRLDADHHDGVDTFRLLADDPACGCFRYHGPAYSVP